MMHKFKSIALATAALLSPTVASAADLPSHIRPPVFVPPPTFSWTGFYVGANAGYGFGAQGSNGPSDLTVPAAIVGTFAVTPANGAPFLSNAGGRKNGFVGGGQIGYNYQLVGSNIVIGAEADFQYSSLSSGSSNSGLSNGLGVATPGGGARVAPDGTGRGVAALGTGLSTANGNVAFFNNGRRGPGEFLGTVRGRVGYAFDTVLFYATGGFAYSSSRASGVNGGYTNGAAVPAAFYTDFGAQAAGAAVSPSTTRGSGQYGYVVGAGIEYALPPSSFLNVFHSSAVTLKVEGLYFNLGHAGLSNGAQIVGVSNTGAIITGTNSGARDNDFGLVRAGINFKFDSLQAPVVARY